MVRRTDYAEALLHAAEHCHPRVNDAVDVEVPGRNQHRLDAGPAVAACQWREIHVLANCHSKCTSLVRDRGITITGTKPRLNQRDQMALGIINLQITSRVEKPRAIVAIV